MRKEIKIIDNPKLNNLTMYRIVNDLPFIPYYYFDEENKITNDSSIVVNYLEYYKDNDGNKIMVEKKNYIVKGTKAVNWFNTLARTPLTATIGIMDEIEYILGLLPIGITTDYIIS